MPVKDRPPSFQFYPRDLLSSTAVSRMSPEARGGYLMLLAHAWLQPRPGWLVDDDEALSALSGLNGQWEQCRPHIARAFEVRKGWWVQTRMVAERRRQRRRYNQAKNGARVTNRKRWTSVAQRTDSESLSVTPASASASASAVEPKSTPTARPVRPRLVAEGFAALPTNTNGDWQASMEEVEAWTAAYPAVEIKSTFNEMRAWLIANPTKRKTFNGMPRFVNSWLAREQNRP